MLPKQNEKYADYILSVSKNGLYDMVNTIKMDSKKENLLIDIQPHLIESFMLKFPDASLVELDNAVNWIILKSHMIELDMDA